MNAHDYADLEIALSHHRANQYRVELRFRRPGSDLVQAIDPVLTTLDLDRFGALDDPVAHGQALTGALFGPAEVMTPFVEARATARSQHPPLPLRLRIRFDWQAAQLHALRWETLHDPRKRDAFLATDQNILLSR